MKNKTLHVLTMCTGLIFASCSFDNLFDPDLAKTTQGNETNIAVSTQDATLELAQGATQISGIGYYDAGGECNTAGEGATFSLVLTGDLEGCLYTFVDEYDCSPGGTYMEIGREYFVGTYLGDFGTFWTNYRFEAKFEGCNEDGSYAGAEIKGRCQHPIEDGTGTGVFEGVTGRLDFKDDIDTGNYPYRGHLRSLDL